MKKNLLISCMLILLSGCTFNSNNATKNNNQCKTNDDCAKLFTNTSDLPGPDPKYICEKNACVRNLD